MPNNLEPEEGIGQAAYRAFITGRASIDVFWNYIRTINYGNGNVVTTLDKEITLAWGSNSIYHQDILNPVFGVDAGKKTFTIDQDTETFDLQPCHLKLQVKMVNAKQAVSKWKVTLLSGTVLSDSSAIPGNVAGFVATGNCVINPPPAP